jgi:thioredoxin-like negative regulator of GroEL
MLVVFRAAWCRWSGELVQAAVADPRVVRLSRRFTCMAVDADRHADACRQFGVQAFPTVIILDATGTERFRATGSAASAHIATAMSEVLTDQPRPRRIAAEPSGPAR